MYTFQRESNIHPSKTGNSERKIVKYSSRKTKVESSLSYLLLSFQVMLLRILNFYGCPEEAIESDYLHIRTIYNVSFGFCYQSICSFEELDVRIELLLWHQSNPVVVILLLVLMPRVT